MRDRFDGHRRSTPLVDDHDEHPSIAEPNDAGGIHADDSHVDHRRVEVDHYNH